MAADGRGEGSSFKWQRRLKREYAEFITSNERAFEFMRYIKHVFVCVEHIQSEQFESFPPTTDFIDWHHKSALMLLD